MDAAPAPIDHGAAIVAWPTETARRDELAGRGVPRLLVLEAGVLPPEGDADLEDWIWLPADERDVFARLRHLQARARRARLDAETVRADGDGVAWIAAHRIALPPVEAAVLRLLADPPERLCSRRDLEDAAWGHEPRRRRSLDSRIFVLRRRLAPHGLEVHAVRGRGFVLARRRPTPGGAS